jgi:hypothetical protein
MKQSRKDFIKQAHESACSDWKKNIEKEFPKLFKEDSLEVGKWYRSSIDCIFNYNGVKDCNNKPCGYGIGRFSNWYESDQNGWGGSSTLATYKEVEQSLIKEAKKRGFKEGVSYIAVGEEAGVISNLGSGEFRYGVGDKDALCVSGYPRVYYKGEWATIIKQTITKEQAEKELGKTILN